MRLGIATTSVVAAVSFATACFSDGAATDDTGAFFFEDGGPIQRTDSGKTAEGGAQVDASSSDAAPLDAGGIDSALDASDDSAIDASIDAAPSTYAATVMADSPLSYWRFGEANGTSASDLAGSTPGEYFGGFTLGAPGAIAHDSNTAVAFDGMSGYVSMGAGLGFAGKASMSIELWVKPAPADGNFRRLVSKETVDGNGREGYLMGYEGSNDNLSFERFQSGVETAIGGSVTANVFSHVVATFDGTTMVFYVNAAVIQSSTATQSLASFSDPFNVATYSTELTADCFQGTVDEVAVYDHALSSARVQEHYRVGMGM